MSRLKTEALDRQFPQERGQGVCQTLLVDQDLKIRRLLAGPELITEIRQQPGRVGVTRRTPPPGSSEAKPLK